MQAGRQRSSGWRRHAGDVLKNTGPGMVASPLSPPRGGGGRRDPRCRYADCDFSAFGHIVPVFTSVIDVVSCEDVTATVGIGNKDFLARHQALGPAIMCDPCHVAVWFPIRVFAFPPTPPESAVS